jgi:hypothetical protein
MKKVIIEMPLVSECLASQCAYNVNQNCHARAITVGDTSKHAACDTFMNESHHIHDTKRVAGIGACKATSCKFNDDFECMTETIRIGMVMNEANCMTFAMR